MKIRTSFVSNSSSSSFIVKPDDKKIEITAIHPLYGTKRKIFNNDTDLINKHINKLKSKGYFNIRKVML